MNIPEETHPAAAAAAAAISVTFVALAWWWIDSAWALLTTPLFVYWVLGVYLQGDLHERPQDQWDSVKSLWSKRL